MDRAFYKGSIFKCTKFRTDHVLFEVAVSINHKKIIVNNKTAV